MEFKDIDMYNTKLDALVKKGVGTELSLKRFYDAFLEDLRLEGVREKIKLLFNHAAKHMATLQGIYFMITSERLDESIQEEALFGDAGRAVGAIADNSSLKDRLKMAAAAESSLAEFYADLARRAADDRQISKLLSAMAQEKGAHAQLLNDMLQVLGESGHDAAGRVVPRPIKNHPARKRTGRRA